MLRGYVAGALGVLAFGYFAAAGAQPAAPPQSATPLPAPRATAMIAFAEFQPGLWTLKRDGSPPREICLAQPDALIQFHHAGMPCSRLVIADAKAGATIHYSCPGAGWGRTAFKVDSPRHMTIATQGIAQNLPFDESIDARRTGDCAAGAEPAMARR